MSSIYFKPGNYDPLTDMGIMLYPHIYVGLPFLICKNGYSTSCKLKLVYSTIGNCIIIYIFCSSQLFLRFCQYRNVNFVLFQTLHQFWLFHVVSPSDIPGSHMQYIINAELFSFSTDKLMTFNLSTLFFRDLEVSECLT